MDFPQISEALREDALAVAFLNVLLQQLGLPIPAVPTLMIAGSLASTPGQLGKILAAAILASVIADWVWYQAGKFFGYRVLGGLCKLSISPASCVSQTEARFIRWGVGSLIIAKFVPGFSTVAPPIAGALRMRLPGFLLAAGTGAGLWAGVAIGSGWFLQDTVQAAIETLSRHSGLSLALITFMVAGWLAWKIWQRHRFMRAAAIAHISPDELAIELRSAAPPLILDLRGATMIAETGPIPGARMAEHDTLLEATSSWPKGHPVVTLCACPDDASAVQAARTLQDSGFLSVRPLKGGYESWRAMRLG